jgi:hypothetical protein
MGVGASFSGELLVTEVTYVSYVPKRKRAKLRSVLRSEDTGSIRWHEKKKLFGSEFYFSGPTELVRKTHAYITQWLATDEFALK